ncbi:glycosyltransferase family 2 protein [Vibrio parahaemolyticus]
MGKNVSIIIPVYNCEKYIEECIKSVINNTHANIEVIIVNDGSSDSTEEIILGYKNSVKLVSITNSGANVARRIGLEHSTGDYIMFLDADDLLSSTAIELLVNAFEVNNGVDIVIGQSTSFGNGRKLKTNFKLGLLEQPIKNYMNGDLPYTLWPSLYRRELVQHLGFVNNIRVGEDYVFNASAFLKSKSVFVIDDIVHSYRRHNESITASTNYGKFDDSYKSFTMVLEIVSKIRYRYPQEVGFHKLQYLYSLIISRSPFRNKCLKLVREDVSHCALDANKRKLGLFRYLIIKTSLFSSFFASMFGCFYQISRRFTKLLVG